MKPSKVFLGSFALGLVVLGVAIVYKSNLPAPRQLLTSTPAQPPPQPNPRQPAISDPARPLATAAAPDKHPALTDFRNWANKFLAGEVVSAPDGERFAVNRRNYMRHLIKTDPQLALAEAAPERWRRELPPAVTQHFEQRVDDQGAYEVRIGTDFEAQTAQVSREVTLGDQRYDAFTYGWRRGQISQESMPIHGIAIDKYLALGTDALRLLEPLEAQAAGLKPEEICGVSGLSVTSKPQPVAAHDGRRVRQFCGIGHYNLMNEQWLAASGTAGGGGVLGSGKVAKDTWNQGKKSLLYIRLNFPDNLTEPISEAAAYNIMNSVNDFYVEGSYNTCQMLPVVTPLLTLPHPKSYYTDAGAGALQSDARQLAREVGFETAKYDRDIVAFTGVPGFDWGGLASVGGKGVWLQGTGVGVTCHELGHNEGLWHANWWDTSANSSITGVGSHIEYGNVYDTMGSAGANANQFNAMHKWRIDWLSERYIHDINTNGVFRLYPHDVNIRTNTHRMAAKVRKDWQRDYWIEMRQRFPGNPWLVNGISVNWSPWDESSGGTHLLDTTPGTPTGQSSREDAAVTIGRTFSDAVSGVYITPIARGGVGPATWMDVVVNTGAFVSNRPPTVILAADLTNAPVGGRINFSAIATDLDGDALAYHWEFGDLTFFTNNTPLAFKTWNTTGDHVVRLEVSDMKGGRVSANVLVTVGNLATTNRVMGRFTETNGVAVEGVRIDNEATDAAEYFGGYSDSGGNYILGDIPPGTTLKPVKYGYTFEPATITVSFPPDISTNMFTATAMTTVNIAALTNVLAEPGESTDFVITRKGDTNQDLEVTLFRSGTATMDSDYSLASLTSDTNFYSVIIPAGSNSVTITMQVLDDISGEGPETVSLTLAELTNAPTYIVTTLGEATVTILDNDNPAPPTLSISATTSAGDNSSPETGEDSGRFVITRAGNIGNDITVFYTVGGTATAGVDYEALPGVAIISAGETSVSVEFITIDDPYVEPEETVSVTITPNAAYGGGGSSTVRIIDDDLVSVTIAATDSSAAEPSATGRFTVTRTGNLVPSMVVNYTVSGTATNTDFQPLSGSVTIPAGETIAHITLTPLDDLLAEGDETVTLSVTASATYNVGTPGAATIVIRDNEQTSVSVSASDDTASEPGSDTGLITISRGSSTSGDLAVFIGVSGTALSGHDYIPLENPVIIPDGASSVDLVITPFNDLHQEPIESVIVTLVSNANYTLPSAASARVDITDDDGSNPPAVGFALATSGAPESRYGGVIVSLSVTSSSPISVNYSVYGGTASTNDYSLPNGTLDFAAGEISKSLPLEIVNDNTVESDETIKIVLSNPVGAAHDGNKFHTYTILDDDKSTITVTATAPTAQEAGVVPGNIRISRTGATNGAQIVLFDVTGSASAPSDYATISHSVTIPAGVTFVNLPVTPVDDNTIEVNETVVVTLTSTPGAKIGGAAEATVTIIDNDPDNLPAIAITAGDAIAAEPGGDTGNFVFSRTGPSNAALTVFYTIGGTAANGSDYTSLATSVNFAIGQTQLVVTVTPLNDIAAEGEETVTLALQMRETYRIGNPGEATVVILDNDQNVWLEVSDSYAAEPGWDTGEFTIMRFGVTNAPVTVLFTRSGTASNGVDLVSITNSIVIPANTNQARLVIMPLDDYLIEPVETVNVTLQSNAAYTLAGGPTAGTVNIHDNEPTVWITSTSTNASENGEMPGILTLERGGDPTVNLEVFVSFTGTAAFGVDYPSFKTNICMPAGVMAAVIYINPTNELVIEGEEFVFAQILPSPAAYTILSPSNATVTIADAGTNRFPVALITSPTVPTIFSLTSNLNVMLEATGTDEVVATTNLVFAWDVVSGLTNNVIFGDPATNNTTVSFTNAGVYVLRLATSDGALRGFSYLTVVVDSTNLFAPDLLHWAFDETDGTNAFDSTGQGRDGFVTGATWGPNGRLGGALTFTGTSNSVSEISGTNFLDGLDALSVAMWVKTSSTNTERGLFAGGVVSGTNRALSLWQGDFGSCRGISNLIQAVLPTTGGDVRVTSSQKFASNQWQHVALVWTNGAPLALYINGTLDAAASRTAAVTGTLTNCSQFVIGRGVGTNYWQGQVDDVRMFARALDLGEVKSLVAMPPTNYVPIVEAGSNLVVQIVTPGNLAGEIYDDGRPLPPGLFTNVWQFVGGDGVAIIAEPTNLTSAISFTNFGNYAFRLMANDGTAKVYDDVWVTVTEPTTVNIFALDGEAAELGPDEGLFMITRSGDTNFDIMVQFTVGGIASNGVDYVTITNSVMLPASSNDVSIVIRPFLENRTEGDEDVTLTILPQLAYTIGNPTATVTIHDSPYGVWTINHFTLEELTDPSLSGELADYDHDGLSNFLEYAFNREPKVGEGGSPLFVTIELNPNDNLNHITATYSRRIQPMDVQYQMVISTNLQTWQSGTNYIETLSIIPDPNPITETVKEQIKAPYTPATIQFLTIRVWRTLQP